MWANSANGFDLTREKKWEKNLEDYRAARKQGIQPSSTSPGAIREAVAISDATGSAFNGG